MNPLMKAPKTFSSVAAETAAVRSNVPVRVRPRVVRVIVPPTATASTATTSAAKVDVDVEVYLVHIDERLELVVLDGRIVWNRGRRRYLDVTHSGGEVDEAEGHRGDGITQGRQDAVVQRNQSVALQSLVDPHRRKLRYVDVIDLRPDALIAYGPDDAAACGRIQVKADAIQLAGG